jgi:signal transduction histidine kinase
MTEATQPTSVARWQRRMLPAELVEKGDGRRSARDWVVDVFLVLAAFGIGVASLYESWKDHSDAMVVIDIVAGVAVILALWVRRKHPIGVAVAAVSVAAFSSMAAGAAPIAVYNVALRSSRRALLGVAVLAVVSIAITPLLYPTPGRWPEQFAFGLLILAVAIGWGLFARARRELVNSLRERAERLESEQRLRVEQAQEAERRRIAREMHDVVAHRLSLLSVHAGALEFRPDAPADEVAEAASVIRDTAQTALQELRDVIGLLREDVDQDRPQPTLAQVPVLLAESRAAGMHVRCQDEPTGVDGVPDAIGRCAYRVVQEGLTNARKHAPNATVDVTLDFGPPLVVQVVSRPPLEPPAPEQLSGTGTGLIGLAERVALLGGRLEHGPDASGDFVLRATLPWTP